VTLGLDTGSAARTEFTVHLENFDGPFDLLLGLISKHQLDVTEVALSEVTDEFISHIKLAGTEWDLEQTTEFLLVASTLLDLKASRLVPSGAVEDEGDLALLEARDILFARLLQYRAYKLVAGEFRERLAVESRRFPRSVGLEPRFAAALPEVLIGLGADELAAVAAHALRHRPEPTMEVAHLHASTVSVRDQGAIVAERLRSTGTATFRSLCVDSPDTMTTVARFLALLELFGAGVVTFEQVTALGELTVRWTGSADAHIDVGDEFEGAR
jgi:segregation and condensation protein A